MMMPIERHATARTNPATACPCPCPCGLAGIHVQPSASVSRRMMQFARSCKEPLSQHSAAVTVPPVQEHRFLLERARQLDSDLKFADRPRRLTRRHWRPSCRRECAAWRRPGSERAVRAESEKWQADQPDGLRCLCRERARQSPNVWVGGASRSGSLDQVCWLVHLHCAAVDKDDG
jgi:hypothetical protein